GDGTVADRVSCDLPACTMRARDDPAWPLDVHLEEAAIAGLALEVSAHGRGAADQGPVGEDLHSADAQPLVAPPRANAQIEAKAAAVSDCVGQIVESLGGDHQGGAHTQASLAARLLPNGQFDRTACDAPAADTRFLHARQPFTEIPLARAPDRFDQLLLWIRV